MTDDSPTNPEVVERFALYYRRNPAWGSLHVVLDDGNTDCAAWCEQWADERRDAEGAALAGILRRMTEEQVRELPRVVYELVRLQDRANNVFAPRQ